MEDLIEVIRSLIYHGRYFSSKRDEIVINKAFNKIEEIFGINLDPIIRIEKEYKNGLNDRYRNIRNKV